MSSRSRIIPTKHPNTEAWLFKTAGRAALAIALLYILLPLLRAIITGLLNQEEETFTAPATVPERSWEGIYGCLVLGALGMSIIIMVVAVDKLLRLHSSNSGAWREITTLCGIFAGLGALLSAFTARSMFGPASAALSETGADGASQLAALQSVNVVAGAFLLLLTVGLSLWLIGVARMNWGLAKAGITDRAGLVFAWVAAATVLAAQLGAMFFAVQFVFVPLFLTLGIGWLRRDRSLSRSNATVQ